MDPFEEFEFKPLTEGLGFHKKADSKPVAAEPPMPSATAHAHREAPQEKNKSISDLIAALPPALDFLDAEPTEDVAPTPVAQSKTAAAKAAPQAEARTQIFQPLGRKEYVAPEPVSIQTRPAAAAELPPLKSNAARTNSQLSNMPPAPTLKSPLSAPKDNDISRSFPHLEKTKTPAASTKAPAPAASVKAPTAQAAATTQPQLRKVAASFSAAILDGMITVGFSTIFLVVILMITRIDLVAMLSHASTDLQTHMHLGLLFLAVLNIYMLSARGMFGATLGEWAFDLQLGTREEQRKPIYLAKIVWRMILVMITGFVLLPIISKIARRDMFATLGGSQLYSRLAR